MAKKTLCPHCKTEMVRGNLRSAADVIYVTSFQSLKSCSLRALICPACGYVELQATDPEKLTRHDFSNEELDAF